MKILTIGNSNPDNQNDSSIKRNVKPRFQFLECFQRRASFRLTLTCIAHEKQMQTKVIVRITVVKGTPFQRDHKELRLWLG